MSTYLTIDELLDLPLLGMNDLLKRNKGRLLKFSKFVADDLKLTVLRTPNRQIFNIDKRTNSITLPCDYSEVSSVNLKDRWGNQIPVWRNERLTGDIVDIAALKDCACEYKCGYKLCNTMKSYVATKEVVTDKMPDNTDVSFTCVNRKTVDRSGNVHEQKQYPQRVYLSGVWTNTILYTENIYLCKVEVDKNGCVCDTEENIEALCNTCCPAPNPNAIPYGGNSENPPCPDVNTWIYYCNSKMDWFSVQCGQEHLCCYDPFRDIYNISEDGRRLLFPHNFGFDRVVVRWYGTPSTQAITMPLIAADVFAMGLLWWDARFDPNKVQLAAVYGKQYSDLKWGLLGELNKRRLAEYRMILTPPTFVPSFINPLNYSSNNNYGY